MYRSLVIHAVFVTSFVKGGTPTMFICPRTTEKINNNTAHFSFLVPDIQEISSRINSKTMGFTYLARQAFVLILVIPRMRDSHQIQDDKASLASRQMVLFRLWICCKVDQFVLPH